MLNFSLALKYQTRLKIFAKDEHSSLLFRTFAEDEKVLFRRSLVAVDQNDAIVVGVDDLGRRR